PQAPLARPSPPPVDLSLGDGFEMRRPLRDGRLSLIPLIATHPAPAGYITLAAAVARHQATVRELPAQWRVDSVRTRNRGRIPAVAYAGGVLLDAKQARGLAEPRVIPPGASDDLAVRCIEQSRETGGRVFHVPGVLAELDL